MNLLTCKHPTLTYFILLLPHLFLTLHNATVNIIWITAGVRHTALPWIVGFGALISQHSERLPVI